MCGRVVYPDSDSIVKSEDLKYDGEKVPGNINLPPTLKVPVVTNSKPDTLQYFNWSLIPPSLKVAKPDLK